MNTPLRVLEILSKVLPLIGSWILVALEQGRDAEAELRALLDTADVVVDEVEDKKFPPSRGT